MRLIFQRSTIYNYIILLADAGFTPVLVKAYIRLQEELKAKGEKFEVVYLSADRTEDQFRHYFDTMPWLALPFGHKTIAELSNKYTVRGIPTLILLHKDGKVFNVDGRGTVTSDPEGSSWLVKK